MADRPWKSLQATFREAADPLAWVKSHYAQQSKVVGKAAIRDLHREIARQLHRWCTESGEVRRVLELGAGACGLAAAMAEHGYEVTAVEFNPADIELARTLVNERGIENLHIVDGDFYDVKLEHKFDFVYYWDGFGVGEDADQRRLLTRIGTEWLSERGFAVIDVFSPWNWQANSGTVSTFTANDGSAWTREVQFDAATSRFRDFLRPKDGATGAVLSQSIRLYSLQEFQLLVEGTGMRVEKFYTDFDTPIVAPGTESREVTEALLGSNGFYVRLVKA